MFSRVLSPVLIVFLASSINTFPLSGGTKSVVARTTNKRNETMTTDPSGGCTCPPPSYSTALGVGVAAGAGTFIFLSIVVWLFVKKSRAYKTYKEMKEQNMAEFQARNAQNTTTTTNNTTTRNATTTTTTGNDNRNRININVSGNNNNINASNSIPLQRLDSLPPPPVPPHLTPVVQSPSIMLPPPSARLGPRGEGSPTRPLPPVPKTPSSRSPAKSPSTPRASPRAAARSGPSTNIQTVAGPSSAPSNIPRRDLFQASVESVVDEGEP